MTQVFVSVARFSLLQLDPDLRAQDDRSKPRRHYVDHNIRAVRCRFRDGYLHGPGDSLVLRYAAASAVYVVELDLVVVYQAGSHYMHRGVRCD